MLLQGVPYPGGGGSAPSWSGSGVSLVAQGNDEYLVTKAVAGDAWDAGAWTGAIAGNFRIRFQPQQTDKYMALGLASSPGATNPGGLQETAYAMGTGRYVALSAWATVSEEAVYPGGHYFWLERVGNAVKAYQGGNGTFDTATLFHSFSSDGSDTSVPKLIIHGAGGAAKVKAELF